MKLMLASGLTIHIISQADCKHFCWIFIIAIDPLSCNFPLGLNVIRLFELAWFCKIDSSGFDRNNRRSQLRVVRVLYGLRNHTRNRFRLLGLASTSAIQNTIRTNDAHAEIE
jgi:hypothetical protein